MESVQHIPIADSEEKKIVSTKSSLAIIKFVIPLVAVTLIMIGSIFLIDHYSRVTPKGAPEDLTPFYIFFATLMALLAIIFVVNANLMKLVNIRTRELQAERDVLQRQNEEKTQLIGKSRMLEKQLQKSLYDLKKAERSKDEFVAMITHELKAPLSPIKGYVDLLLSKNLGSLTDDQKHMIELIQSSSKSLIRLIQDLLDVQKTELGQLKLDKQKNYLSGIISSTVSKIQPDLERKRISIKIILQNNPSCLCDEIRIEQVLTNLILNSMDFVPKENGEISITLISKNDMAEIIVKDNGTGIRNEDLEKLFVKFYQVDTSRTREGGGSGLGLSICKGIVENHGGKIWAESKGSGMGAEFHFTLPMLQSD